MIFIRIEFPAGRWHATAWGSHVNEGVPEWPPCPWRLCRALIATWHWKNRTEEPILHSLIKKLSEHPPKFLLPEASAAHTRHYMPVIEGKRETKTKVFDAFVHVNAGESLWIQWNVDLNSEERVLLATLLESLNYLGRAESLVSAALSESGPVSGRWTAAAESSDLDGEPIRLLAPQTEPSYSRWVAEQAKAAPAKPKGKKKGQTLPESLFAALQLDTADWKQEGWNVPPGSRWIEYVRPRDCFKIAPSSSGVRNISRLPRVARFGIISEVPPSITQALSLSERFHQALCSKIKKGEQSQALTGRTLMGEPLIGNSHVYYLPECDDHGYVTHMTLHAPSGFDPVACRALGKLRSVWGAEGFDINIILLATGQAQDFSEASPYFQKSKSWRSITPFIPVRHAKANRSGIPKIDEKKRLQIGSPEHDCWRLLETLAPETNTEKPFPIANVSLADYQSSKGTRIKIGPRDIPCMDFQRNRRTGNGTRAGNRGYALRIDFQESVAMPFGLGYGAHFGLGLFVPADKEAATS